MGSAVSDPATAASNVPLRIDLQRWGLIFALITAFSALHESLRVRRCGRQIEMTVFQVDVDTSTVGRGGLRAVRPVVAALECDTLGENKCSPNANIATSSLCLTKAIRLFTNFRMLLDSLTTMRCATHRLLPNGVSPSLRDSSKLQPLLRSGTSPEYISRGDAAPLLHVGWPFDSPGSNTTERCQSSSDRPVTERPNSVSTVITREAMETLAGEAGVLDL